MACGVASAASIEVSTSLETPQSIQIKLLDIARDRQLSSKEQFDLSLSFMRSASFVESLTTARLALGTTTNHLEKAAFYVVISQSLGALGDYQAAAEAALAGQRLNPTSRELAALRRVYFELVGDLAQKQAAEDTLAQLSPSGEKVALNWRTVYVAVEVGKPIIEALVKIYEKWYEATLMERGGSGASVREKLIKKMELVANTIEVLWPLVEGHLTGEKEVATPESAQSTRGALRGEDLKKSKSTSVKAK